MRNNPKNTAPRGITTVHAGLDVRLLKSTTAPTMNPIIAAAKKVLVRVVIIHSSC
jgi:hypothetical protein